MEDPAMNAEAVIAENPPIPSPNSSNGYDYPPVLHPLLGVNGGLFVPDPDQAAWLAAQDQLPDAVRAGLLRWAELPEAIRAGIEALLSAAVK
jgi:hypothetical protein